MVWLSAAAGVSFALFVGIIISAICWYAGALGRVLLLATTAGSAVVYIAPDAAAYAFTLFGIGLALTGAVAAAARAAQSLFTRDASSYVKAVRSGDTTAWWKPTLLDRVLERDRYLTEVPPDPTAIPDLEAVAALHAQYAAHREQTGDPLVPPTSPLPLVTPPNPEPQP